MWCVAVDEYVCITFFANYKGFSLLVRHSCYIFLAFIVIYQVEQVGAVNLLYAL